MKQTVMLKKNYEFKIVLTKGRFYIGKQLKIVILKNGKNFKTLGIAVSTKNGKAFQRNKAKRLIREAYKNLEEKIINGYSIVVLLKKDIEFSRFFIYILINIAPIISVITPDIQPIADKIPLIFFLINSKISVFPFFHFDITFLALFELVVHSFHEQITHY